MNGISIVRKACFSTGLKPKPCSIVQQSPRSSIKIERGDAQSSNWVTSVTISGFTFRDTTYSRNIGVYEPPDAAIWLSATQGCRIIGNRFLGIGGYAIHLTNQSSKDEIVGNEIGPMGEGGVTLTGSVASQPHDNLVAGNWIHDGGKVYAHVAGVYCETASGTEIRNNRIERMPRYGVSLKGFNQDNYSHNNVVEYNDLLFTNLETNDTGAIEMLGREKTDMNNVVQFNRIFDVVGMKTSPDGQIMSPYFTWGIYLDDFSSGVTVRGNLVVRDVVGGGFIHGGRNNLFENNIFVAGSQAQFRAEDINGWCANNRVLHNIMVATDPKASLYGSGNWKSTVLSLCDYNLFWNSANPAVLATQPMAPVGTWSQWQAAGFDKHSIFGDPQFVNQKHDDYRLRPSSPAFVWDFNHYRSTRSAYQAIQAPIIQNRRRSTLHLDEITEVQMSDNPQSRSLIPPPVNTHPGPEYDSRNRKWQGIPGIKNIGWTLLGSVVQRRRYRGSR